MDSDSLAPDAANPPAMADSLIDDYLGLSRRDRKAVMKSLSGVDRLRLKRLVQAREAAQPSVQEAGPSRSGSQSLSPVFADHIASTLKAGGFGPATAKFLSEAMGHDEEESP